MKLMRAPLTLQAANEFVAAHHRHHKPVVGHKFSIGATLDDTLVGAVIVGRPVSRMRDDGRTLEVTRLCTDGTRNACSFLYGAAARAAFALGYQRIGTYILASEPGTSLTATGWRLVGETAGGSWSRVSRPRNDDAPTTPKLLFQLEVAGGMRAREVIAADLCATYNHVSHHQLDSSAFHNRADEIIAALRAAGFELCPVNPTTAMKHAGRIMNSKIGEDMAEACYRAMISAAKEQT